MKAHGKTRQEDSATVEDLQSPLWSLETVVTGTGKTIEDLLESETLFGRIIEATTDAIVVADENEIVHVWNPAAESMFGYSGDEIIGRSFVPLIIPPDHRPARDRSYRKAVETGKLAFHGKILDAEGLRKDGSRFPLEHTVSMWRYRRGTRFVAILRDVTERRRIGEELRKHRENLQQLVEVRTAELKKTNERLKQEIVAHRRLASIVEHSDDAIIGKTLDGIILSWNKGAERIYQYTQEEAVGRSILFLVPDDRVAELLGFYDRLRKGESLEHFETVRKRRDGSLIDVSLTISPIRDEDGNTIGAAAIGRDITQRKNAERALRERDRELLRLNEELENRVESRTADLKEANRVLNASLLTLRQTQEHLVQSQKMAALGELVAGVAHEINTPVGVAITAASYLEIKLRELSDTLSVGNLKVSDLAGQLKTDLQIVGTILGNLGRAADMVQSFKHVAVDQTSEEPRRFNLNDYIREVLQSLRPQYRQTRHTITVDCPEDLTFFSFPGVFYQIISNLVMNSLIHGFEGIDEGKIAFDIRVDGDMLVFGYRDNGRGIPEENLQKVFNPFFTTKRGHGRSGLGLHIVYNLVTQRLKGRIACSSTPAMGTRFEMVIPLKPGV